MERRAPSEALAFAEATRDALARLGGVDLARRAEADPSLRRSRLLPALERLGLLELAPLSEATETIAAAYAVREAGAVVSPWPLVATLSAPSGDCSALYLVQRAPRRLEHLDLLDAVLAADIEGQVWSATPGGSIAHAPLDPFGVPCALERCGEAAPASAVALHLVLDAFWTLGALGTVVHLAAQHARERRQFGRPIGNFGAVRWRLADMALARTGLEELAAYTLWRLVSGQVTRTDALALRIVALEAAGEVLDHGHQVFAAIGLCDEHDLSIIDRHLQPSLRRPGGLTRTTQLFADGLLQDGFDALFAIAPHDVATAAMSGDGARTVREHSAP